MFRKIALSLVALMLFGLSAVVSAQDGTSSQTQAEKIIAETTPFLTDGVQLQAGESPIVSSATSDAGSAITTSSTRYLSVSFNQGHYGPNDVMILYYYCHENLGGPLWAGLDLFDANGVRVGLPTELRLYFPNGIKKGQTGLAIRLSFYQLRDYGVKEFPAGEFHFRVSLSLEPGRFILETATAVGQYLYSKNWERDVPKLSNVYITGQAPPATQFAVIEAFDFGDAVALVRFPGGTVLASEPGTVRSTLSSTTAVKVNLPPSSLNLPVSEPRSYRADIVLIDQTTGKSVTYTQALRFN